MWRRFWRGDRSSPARRVAERALRLGLRLEPVRGGGFRLVDASGQPLTGGNAGETALEAIDRRLRLEDRRLRGHFS